MFTSFSNAVPGLNHLKFYVFFPLWWNSCIEEDDSHWHSPYLQFQPEKKKSAREKVTHFLKEDLKQLGASVVMQTDKFWWQESGTVVKTLLQMPAFWTQIPRFKTKYSPDSSFPLMRSLEGSRQWLRHLHLWSDVPVLGFRMAPPKMLGAFVQWTSMWKICVSVCFK